MGNFGTSFTGAPITTAYDPKGSLLFDASRKEHIKTEMKYVGNLKQWIFSVWFKKGHTKTILNIPRVYDAGKHHDSYISISPTAVDLVSKRANVLGMDIRWDIHLNDATEWYNLVLKFDTTEVDQNNRAKLWINGSLMDSKLRTVPALNYESGLWSQDALHVTGAILNGSTLTQPYDGYIAEMTLVAVNNDLTPDAFGYRDERGVWMPTDVRRTVDPKFWGGNSFYLPMGQGVGDQLGVTKGQFIPNGKNGLLELVGFSPDMLMLKGEQADLTDILTKKLGTDKSKVISLSPELTSNFISKYTDNGFLLGNSPNVNYGPMGKVDYLAFREGPEHGLDIVTWTGDGVHGRPIEYELNDTAQMILVFGLDTNYHQVTWHYGLSSEKILNMTSTGSQDGSGYILGVSSKSFAIGSTGNLNEPGKRYVAYVITSVPGVCKVGTVTGTGNADSVDLGFKPTCNILKDISGNDDWFLQLGDATVILNRTSTTGRNKDNLADHGFKYTGAVGHTYIYAAWADRTPVSDSLDSIINNNSWKGVNMAAIENISKDSPVNNLPTFSLDSIMNNDASSIYHGGRSFKLYNAGSAGTAICETSTEEDFFFETYISEVSSGSYCSVGVAGDVVDNNQLNLAAASYNSNGTLTTAGSNVPFAGDAFTAGDTIGCFVEPIKRQITFYKNGIKQGTHGYSDKYQGPVKPVFYHLTTSTSYTVATVRFYEDEFVFPPTGVVYKTFDKTERDIPAKTYNVAVYNRNGHDNGYNKALADIPTGGATDITLFEHNNEMFILGINHYDGSYSINSELFKYNPETNVRTLIQSIPTVGGTSAYIWEYGGNKLVSICNREGNKLITYRIEKSTDLIGGVEAGITLVKHHELTVTKPTSMVTFVSGSKVFMFVTVQMAGTNPETNSVLFEMTTDGFGFTPIQDIATYSGQDVCVKTIDDTLYLFVSSSRSATTRRVNSELLKFNPTTERLESLQLLPISGAHHGEFFEVDGEHYLVVASYYDDVEKGNTKSYLFKRGDDGLFTLKQRIQTYTCRYMYPIVYQGETYVLVANYRKGEVGAAGYNTDSYILKFDRKSQSLIPHTVVPGKACFSWSSLYFRGRIFLGMASHYDGGTEKHVTQSYLFDIEHLLGITKQATPSKGFGVATYKGKLNSAITQIPTEGTNQLLPFHFNGETYVVIINYYNGSYTTNSKLARFLPATGTLKEIQSIPTNGASAGHHWVYGGRHYVTLLNRNGSTIKTYTVTQASPLENNVLPEIMLREVDNYSYNTPRGMCTFNYEGVLYAMFSSYKSSSSYSTSSKFMTYSTYERKFKWVQDIATVGATCSKSFVIDNEIYVFISFSYDSANYGHNSKLLKFNKGTKKLDLHQYIPTEGGYDASLMEVDGEHYLLIANHYSNALKNLVKSEMLKRNKDTGMFESVQQIQTYSCRRVEPFVYKGVNYVMFTSYTDDGTNTKVNSELMKFDRAKKQLVHFMTIPVIGSFGFETFEHGDKLYGLMASYYDSTTSSYVTKSYLFDLGKLIETGVPVAYNEVDVGFSPDLIWTSRYDMSPVQTRIMNTVAGISMSLTPNSTGAEQDSNTGVVDITKDGYTVNTLDYVNDLTKKHVSWCWRLGPQFGLDIVRYKSYSSAGGDVLYDCGGKAEMIWFKRTDATSNWYVYHKDVPSTYALLLEKSGGKYSTTLFDGFNLKNDRITFTKSSGINSGSYMNQAIFWRSVKGHSKIDSYTGNGNANGPYVPCGFKVTWLLIKRIDGTSNWRVYDSKRNKLNPINRPLSINNPNDSYNGVLDDDIEFTANGFKVKTASSSRNASNGKYLYMAFAEAPIGHCNPV